jgi:hypothetical protein
VLRNPLTTSYLKTRELVIIPVRNINLRVTSGNGVYQALGQLASLTRPQSAT